MSELELRQDNYPIPTENLIPDAARGLVQWAQSARAAYSLAQSLVGTAFAPVQYRGKPEEAAAAMLAGAEVGLSPLASLRAFDNIQGQAAPKAITLRAIVQSHGHDIEITEESATVAKGRARRKGTDRWQSAEWTIQQARDLGLTGKDNWKKQPKSMLVARVTSELARRIAADAILGVPFSSEELQDAIPEPTTTVTRAEPTAPKRVQRTLKTVELPPDVEPTFDEPAQPPPAEAVDTNDEPLPFDPITPAQLKKLHVLFKERDLADRDDALAWASGILGRELESTKSLAKWEASDLIDALGGMSSDGGDSA